MKGLRPCPFCGGEAVLNPTYDTETGGVDGWFVWCDNDTCECKPETGQFFTKAEAIAAWNSRAERTCFADEVTHRDCKYSVNRGWRERTCKCIAEYAKSPIDGKTIVLHRCSSCHELMRPHMSYCPICGCKVVK